MKYYWMGNQDRAIEYMERAVEMARAIGHVRGDATCLSNLAEFCLEKGDVEKAEECCHKAMPMLERLGDQGFIANTHMVYGMIHHKKKEWKEAGREYESAIVMCKEIGHPEVLAQSHLHYGKMLRDKGDPEKAREQLTEAKDVWEEMGNEKRVKEIDELLEEMEPPKDEKPIEDNDNEAISKEE